MYGVLAGEDPNICLIEIGYDDKFLHGAWAIGIGAGGELLANVLGRYYGIK